MSTKGTVQAIFIAPDKGAAMEGKEEVLAIAGKGLDGDRYAEGKGAWSKVGDKVRHVTLINGAFIPDSGFEPEDTRRNIVTDGIELMQLTDREFTIGEARFRGVEYCDPCSRPSKLASKDGFAEAFHDRAGIRAEVVEGGVIRLGDSVEKIEASKKKKKSKKSKKKKKDKKNKKKKRRKKIKKGKKK